MRCMSGWSLVLWGVCATALLGCPSTPEPPTTTTWAKTYGSSLDDEAFAMAQTADGGFILAGNTLNQVARSDGVYANAVLVKAGDEGGIQWSSVFGGAYGDEAYDVQQTLDGGYIFAGETLVQIARSVDVYSDMYLVKTDAQGNGQWSKTFGGGLDDAAYAVQQTTDGGFILAGSTLAQIAKGSQTYDTDMYLVRTDAQGVGQWSRTFGGGLDDAACAVQQTTDGGFILAGSTLTQIARSTLVYDTDMSVVKTDAAGNEAWSASFGDSLAEAALDVRQTTDGGYVIAGYADSFTPARAMYLVKTDSGGNGQWSRTFAGSGGAPAHAASVRQTTDGGYILAGTTGDASKSGASDVYIVKTDSAGNLQWSKVFGGNEDEAGSAVCQTSDGGYAVAGSTLSFGNGGWDMYLVRTDASGNGSGLPGP
jgi:hypothetical protein